MKYVDEFRNRAVVAVLAVMRRHAGSGNAAQIDRVTEPYAPQSSCG